MQLPKRPQRRIRDRFSRQDWEHLMRVGKFLRSYVKASTMEEADAVIVLGEQLIREAEASEKAPAKGRAD